MVKNVKEMKKTNHKRLNNYPMSPLAWGVNRLSKGNKKLAERNGR